MTTQTPTKNGHGSAIQRSGNEKMANLKALFSATAAKGGLSAVLPKHLPAEKVIRLVLSAASRTPELLECSAPSILLAAMQSAALGLEPNTPLQQAYLVPYMNKKTGQKEAQFIPGYRGLIQLATQSGYVLAIEAHAVLAGDHFVYEQGLTAKLEHRPSLDTEDDEDDVPDVDKLVAVYAIARMSNGYPAFVVLTRKQILSTMRKSQTGGKYGPWRDHFLEMAKKTAIRKLAKWLPMSAERDSAFVRGVQAHARSESGEAPDTSDVLELMPTDARALLGDGAREAPEPSGDPLADRLAEKAKAEP